MQSAALRRAGGRWYTSHYFAPGADAVYFRDAFGRALAGGCFGRMPKLAPHVVRSRLSRECQLVVKDVNTFLSIGWLASTFDVRVIGVSRHLGAIYASELRRFGPGWDPDPEILLAQRDLMADHLSPYEEVLRNAQSAAARRAMLIASRLRVFANEAAAAPDWLVVSYERLAASPMPEFRAMFETLDLGWDDAVARYVDRNTTREQSGTYLTARRSEDHIDQWRTELRRDEIAEVEAVVEEFGLAEWIFRDGLHTGGGARSTRADSDVL
ncbi:MAG: hypothetical protein GKS06_04170 [Acidobacteria bacterium]|nr:hypothetical protein [Acidobacteriota bacterium]